MQPVVPERYIHRLKGSWQPAEQFPHGFFATCCSGAVKAHSDDGRDPTGVFHAFLPGRQTLALNTTAHSRYAAQPAAAVTCGLLRSCTHPLSLLSDAGGERQAHFRNCGESEHGQAGAVHRVSAACRARLLYDSCRQVQTSARAAITRHPLSLPGNVLQVPETAAAEPHEPGGAGRLAGAAAAAAVGGRSAGRGATTAVMPGWLRTVLPSP